MSLQHHIILKYHPVFSTIRSEVLIQVNPKILKAKSRTFWTPSIADPILHMIAPAVPTSTSGWSVKSR
jgi:hypothetical protein